MKNPPTGQQVNREYFLTHLHTAIVDVWVCRLFQRDFAELYKHAPNVYARVAAASSGFKVTEAGTITGLEIDKETLEEGREKAIQANKRTLDMTSADLEQLIGKLKLNFSDPTTFEVCFDLTSRPLAPSYHQS